MPRSRSTKGSRRATMWRTPAELGCRRSSWFSAGIPAIAILYTVYARACDPVLEFLKMGGQHSDEEIIDLVLATCFEGLNAR